MITELQKYLRIIGACQEAREWAGDRTFQQAWDESPRADWLLWWVAKCNVNRKVLVMAGCQCARTSLKYVRSGELRPLQAIEITEAWCEGKATLKEVEHARHAVYVAVAADAAAYAAHAAHAAAYAVDAAAYTTYIVYAAADAAKAAAAYAVDAAAYAVNAAKAAGAAEAAAHISMCAIVRGVVTFDMLCLPVGLLEEK